MVKHRGNSAGAIFFATLPIAASLGARSLPVLQAIAALWGAPWQKLPRLGRANIAWLVPLLLALAWAVASAFWSITPDAPVRSAKFALVIGLALLFAASTGHSPSARDLTRASLWISALALAGLLGVEAAFGMPLNRLAQPNAIDMIALQRNPGRGVCILTLLVFPAFISLWQTGGRSARAAGIVLLGTGAWLSLQFDLAANFVALGAGTLAFLLGLAWPRAALALSGTAWASWLVAAPWLSGMLKAFHLSLPLSWRMRQEIWEFASDRIRERTVTGWGFESSRSFAGLQSLDGVTFANVPLHTHSGSIQIWLEFGAVGAALWALAILFSTRSAIRALGTDRLAAAGAAATAAAAMVHFNVSYGAWQEWWLVTLSSAAIGAACLRARSQD